MTKKVLITKKQFSQVIITKKKKYVCDKGTSKFLF